MKELVLLELKKIDPKDVGILGLIAGVVSLVYLVLTAIVLNHQPIGIEQLFYKSMMYNKISFTIFAAVLIHKMFSQELATKSISILFTYPISRMKLLVTKVILIVIVTLPFMYVSMVLHFILIGLGNGLFHFAKDGMSLNVLFKYLGVGFIHSLLAMLAAFIPMIIDVKFSSTQYTLIFAGIMAIFLYGVSYNALSLVGYILMIVVAILGLITVKKSLDYVIQKDIM